MQYILWLAPLAVLCIAKIQKSNNLLVTYGFALWQLLEIGFRYSYFQNAMSKFYESKGTPLADPLTDATYGFYGLLRYAILIIFTIILFRQTFKTSVIASSGDLSNRN